MYAFRVREMFDNIISLYKKIKPSFGYIITSMNFLHINTHFYLIILYQKQN